MTYNVVHGCWWRLLLGSIFGSRHVKIAVTFLQISCKCQLNLITSYFLKTTLNNDSVDLLPEQKYCQLFTRVEYPGTFLCCQCTQKCH